MGTSSSSAAGDVYNHVYSKLDNLPSLTIEDGFNLDTDKVRYLLGCKGNEVRLSGVAGEPLRFSQSFFFKKTQQGSTLDSTPAKDSVKPLTFGMVDFQYPAGTSKSRTQRIEFILSNGLIRTYGNNSNLVSHLTEGARGFGVTFDKPLENFSDTMDVMTGSETDTAETLPETASMVFTAATGTSTTFRTITIELTKLKPTTLNTPDGQPDTRIDDTISFTAMTGTLSGRDSLATTIFD